MFKLNNLNSRLRLKILASYEIFSYVMLKIRLNNKTRLEKSSSDHVVWSRDYRQVVLVIRLVFWDIFTILRLEIVLICFDLTRILFKRSGLVELRLFEMI